MPGRAVGRAALGLSLQGGVRGTLTEGPFSPAPSAALEASPKVCVAVVYVVLRSFS